MSNLSNTDWDSAVTDAGAVVEIAKLHIDTEDAKGNLTGTYDVYNISNGTHAGNKIEFTANGADYKGRLYFLDLLITGKKPRKHKPHGGGDDPIWVAEQGGNGLGDLVRRQQKAKS